MEIMSCFKSLVIHASAPDIISSLPDEILENILMRIPLRAAVGTSVLSKRWKDSWKTLQQLVFDDTICNLLPYPDFQEAQQMKILLIIAQVLLRIKTVRKFYLSCGPLISRPEIDNFIMILPSTRIEELTLHLHGGNPHKLPRCLFSYHNLTHLDLSNCVFSLPATFRGFSLVVSLVLVYVNITEDSLMKLISSCPILESLTFVSETTRGPIKIDNPSLKILILGGTFNSISLKNSTRLATVSLWGTLEEPMKYDRFFSNFSALEILEMNGWFMKCFISEGLSQNSSLRNLRLLKLIDVSLESSVQADVALWLLSSPNLQTLTIQVTPFNHDTQRWFTFGRNTQGRLNIQRWQEFCLNKLRQVQMENYCGTRNETEFLKYILTRSRVLESLVIKPDPWIKATELLMLTELSSCQCLSPKAKIYV